MRKDVIGRILLIIGALMIYASLDRFIPKDMNGTTIIMMLILGFGLVYYGEKYL